MNKLGLTTVKAPGRSVLRMIYGKMLFFTAALFLISIAQGAARQNGITLDVKNQPLGKVLKSIEQQAGYRFSYSPQVVPVNETVTLRVKDKPVHDVLNELLKSFDLSYKAASEKVIVIYKKEDGNRLATDDPVATADTAIVITGRIASSEGEALPGATISVKVPPWARRRM
ncbi:STN domain-containing protein [Chitinophaga sedimenti]|uniref:STN domain-containing protein n=1 Tax=Chitinophaga sedimenti TaxID=2033606 RepID=UPI002002CAE8|nr:STN domain-containing protein [Chitinophaga sedimenti]MCK7554834.1 STN domain-containing protein [Chitinophaga sedimenti]